MMGLLRRGQCFAHGEALVISFNPLINVYTCVYCGTTPLQSYRSCGA